ncbi:MAG TPA: hypothetical protein VF712_14875 [Thermoleophilaceae bacterium]
MRPVGRVGRPHGRDGSFYVEGADSPLAEGTVISVAGRAAVIERRAGTDGRPLIRATGVDPAAVRGAAILVDEPLEEGEYLAEQLVGLEVAGLGRVDRVVNGPSCDVLDVGGTLVPFVQDAVKEVDLERGVIEVDRDFLGL